MATNNILPFCPTDTGTNLLSQGDYAVAPDRTNGNQPGIASSKLVNKAIRQSAFVASQLAQYISDKTNTNVLDDGNTAALLAIMSSAFAPNDGFAVENLTLTAAVGASALTVSVKNALGNNPSATDMCYVSFRNATLTTGTFVRRSISGALNIVVSSGSTLGQVSGQPSAIYVYLIDNAGTVELAVSHSKYPENTLVSTTAEGGAGAADSAITMYSTTARSNVACRLIGILTNTQATAGTWATVPSQIQLMPADISKPATRTKLTSGSGTYYVPAGCTSIRVRMVAGGGGGAGSGTGASAGMTAGGNTTFGTSLLTCTGGGAGTTNGPSGTPGVATVDASVTKGQGWGGAHGANPSSNTTGISGSGGMGGSSPFGGGAGGGGGSNAQSGLTAAANTGAGGGGGGGGTTNATFGGAGGGSGAFIDALIDMSSTSWAASFAYAVGAAGSGGGLGGGAAQAVGGNGGSGIIIIDEYYG